MTPRLYAVIPCAGSGSRAGTAVPKQYEPVAGQPMVLHTLAAFAAVPRLAGRLLVVAPDDAFEPPALAAFTVARCGGATRATSVFNGLSHWLAHGATRNDWVLVHDAARCLITSAQINQLIDACQQDPVGGLLAQPLADTLKTEADGRVADTLDRRGKWLAQTPQMFRMGVLLDALQAIDLQATDEASAIEALGLKPLLVPGSALNFKVTYPDDFTLAQAVLESRIP